MNPQKSSFIWMPLAIALAVIIGIFIGSRFSSTKYAFDNDRKLNQVLNLVNDQYVDTTNLNNLIEMTIPELLSNLDPHTSYFTKSDMKAAEEDLNGTFSGIGVSFVMMNDTISVVEVISGGPSEKVGIMPGDRIVTIDDSLFVGPRVVDTQVVKRLRGEADTKVKLGIKRNNSPKLLHFTVTRGDIPVNTVDAYYMIEKGTGYIKVNQFGANTYDEFINALAQLKDEGAKRFVIDLRGNGGGYMERAVLMANEFLPEDHLIVYTKGRERRDDSQVWSDGYGRFKEAELVVLIDEFSASASEIFAGAIQDNDRGLIVGNRSFGKGLVQRQFVLPDSSAIRLTIARYYTPSGRCIQKDYKDGTYAYEKELADRYRNGELYSKDSIKVDKNLQYTTMHGRTVYGGGGIVPDIFVPRDTTGITSYYIDVVNAGLFQRFAFQYVDLNRQVLSKMKDYKQYLRSLPSDQSLLENFVDYASKNGVTPRWYYINQSREVILTNLKALIARDIFGNTAFYPIYNQNDKTLKAAVQALNKRKAVYPITK